MPKKSMKMSKKNHKSHSVTHKKMHHKGKSMKMPMNSSSEGIEMPVYCVHERKKCTMVDGHKKVITMKNGNKRAMMEGKCKSCGKKVTQFVKM